MKITITPTDNGFSVRQGALEIGCWKTAQRAKAARGALDKALQEGVNPALAVFCGIQAANDSVVVGSYNDAPDEHFVSGENTQEMGGEAFPSSFCSASSEL